jgi:hypothetical protein
MKTGKRTAKDTSEWKYLKKTNISVLQGGLAELEGLDVVHEVRQQVGRGRLLVLRADVEHVALQGHVLGEGRALEGGKDALPGLVVDLRHQHRLVTQARLQLLGRALGDDPAIVDDGYVVTEGVRLVHVVGGQDDGDAGVPEGHDLVPDQPAGLGVQAGGGLVQDEHLGRVHHGLGDDQAPLHAARQLVDLRIPLRRQLGEGQHLVDLGIDLPRRDAVELGVVAEVLPHVDIPVQDLVLGHHADVALDIAGVLDDVVAQHRGSTGGGKRQPTQHSDDGRLARPVGSQQSEYLAPGDVQVHPVHRDQLVEPLGEPLETDHHVVVHLGGGWRRSVYSFRGGECGCVRIGSNP